jgi:hypothetical protein
MRFLKVVKDAPSKFVNDGNSFFLASALFDGR